MKNDSPSWLAFPSWLLSADQSQRRLFGGNNAFLVLACALRATGGYFHIYLFDLYVVQIAFEPQS